MFFNILGYFLGRQIVFVISERIFNFFRNKFQTSQNIENENNNGNHIIPQCKYKAKGQSHYEEEYEFFNKGTVRVGNGCIFDSLTGAANFRKRLNFTIQNDQLVSGYFPRLI